MSVPDRSALAGRIQGFGNVNPPPLEEETGATVAKKAVGRLGDVLGEEVMLTVEDFKEKGAVVAVKDAVADAGDILIDGVAGLIGWFRGDPPVEEESQASEEASKVLANGPNGAAYGISQASPTGGINAVWVMPEEADPATLAQLAAQAGGPGAAGLAGQVADPRVPRNIQPYEPAPGRASGAPRPTPYAPSLPGGPVIAPYEPAPAGPSSRIPPYAPSAGARASAPAVGSPWGPSGYSSASGLATAGTAVSSSSSAPAPASGAKALVERICRGDVLVGPDVAKRLVSQCQATSVSGKRLAEMVCERAKRLYLGLDGEDPVDADAALSRILGLVDALSQQAGNEIARAAVEEIRRSAGEELLSLRSSAKHKDAAEPILVRLGFVAGAPAAVAAAVDLLGGEASVPAAAGAGASAEAPAAASAAVDLLGGGGSAAAAAGAAAAAEDADLLGGADAAASPAPAQGSEPAALEASLLGGEASAPAPALATGPGPLDSLLPEEPAADGASVLVLEGLSPPAAPGPSPAATSASPAAAAAAPVAECAPGTLGAGAVLAEKRDVFGFVGAEMTKAGHIV